MQVTGEHLTENATGEVETIFDGKEREQDHQLKHMAGRELAVRSLGKVHLPVVKRDMRHYVHDSLNRLVLLLSAKKLLSSEIICLFLFMLRFTIFVCFATLT